MLADLPPVPPPATLREASESARMQEQVEEFKKALSPERRRTFRQRLKKRALKLTQSAMVIPDLPDDEAAA